jgi:hypothetical protein
MAELAPELIYFEPIYEVSHFEIEPLEAEILRLPEGSAAILNDLPEFSFVARRARQIGESIRDERMELLRNGEFDAVPMPIDMTGTARRAVEAERQYGTDSPQALIQYQSLEDDADRQMAETVTKMTWGYFPELTHLYDESQRDFMAYGRPLKSMTANGISPMLHSEETERSINDFVLQNLDEAFIHSEYADDHVLIRIAECSDWAIEQYKADQKLGKTNTTYGGLVPETEKFMVQCIAFDKEEGERTLEQVGLPGLEIDRDVLHQALYVLGAIDADTNMAKTELQGTYVMVKKDVISNVLDFVKLADGLAEEKTGRPIRMGEVVTDGAIEYEDVPAEAVRRQQEYAQLTDKLVNKMLDLEREGVDKWQTESHVSSFLKQELRAVVQQKPGEALKIFNKDTADGYVRYQALYRAGKFAEAAMLEEKVFEKAPAPSSCGAGSCGLEGVDETTRLSTIKELGGKTSDKVLKDKVRSCPECGEKSLVYVFNSREVRTKCQGICKKQNLKKTA